MAKFDVTAWTTTDLAEIHSQIEKVLTFRKALGEFLADNDASVEDLNLGVKSKRGRKPKAAPAVGSPGKVAPKWHHKEDSALTWSGRGRTPKWIKKFGVKI